jgi:hypothetical protein
MAHYAFLDENNIVTEVIVGNDNSDVDWEQVYGSFRGQVCKRTSYNTRGGIHYDPNTNQPSADQSKAFRKNYAGIGYFYDSDRDAFIPPKPYPSWMLDEFSCLWNAPVPMPTNGGPWLWDEDSQSWIEVSTGENNG